MKYCGVEMLSWMFSSIESEESQGEQLRWEVLKIYGSLLFDSTWKVDWREVGIG